MSYKSLVQHKTTRRAAGILLILFSPALTLGAQHSDDWIKYDSKEGRYSVLLPAQPTVGSQEATSADGIKFTQYKAAVFSGEVVYMIGYFDYTASMTFTFDKARDGMVGAVNGTLLTERSISLGGYSGRELRVLARDESGAEYDMRARFYDVDRRIFVLQFIAPKSIAVEITDPKATKYFDSFQVVRASQN